VLQYSGVLEEVVGELASYNL